MNEHIVNFQDLKLRQASKNILGISDRLILMCGLCENVQQLRNTRWVQSYLPGIRIALCMYCSNFKFAPISSPTSEYILYYHSSGSVFSTKIKSNSDISTKETDVDIFGIK